MKLSILNFLVLTILIVASCEKGTDMDNDIEEKDDLETKKEEKDKNDCFDFVYPITYLMPTGFAISGNEADMIEAEIKTWYENHPDVVAKPVLQLPVDIIWTENKMETIMNTEELETAWKYCDYGKDYDDKEDCFNLVYPVTYTMPDNSNITGNGEEELWTNIKTWYEAHPDVDEKPSLNYPVQIAYPDSDIPVTINNEEEIIEAKKDCD